MYIYIAVVIFLLLLVWFMWNSSHHVEGEWKMIKSEPKGLTENMKKIWDKANVKVTDVNHFSAYDIIKFKKVVFTESSVKELEKRYS